MWGESRHREPEHDAVLDTVTAQVTELSRGHAVDAATGDVIDQLVDAWLAQWREQLVQHHQARQSALRKRIARARNRLAAATTRAEATAAAQHAAHNGSAAPAPTPEQTCQKQVTNGVRTAAPR
jgi:septal ring factor EnvC (AmiA/AmiB activator)